VAWLSAEFSCTRRHQQIEPPRRQDAKEEEEEEGERGEDFAYCLLFLALLFLVTSAELGGRAEIKELMAMSSKIDQLTALLNRLNSGEDPARVKQEARDFLATVGPEDLSFAEQQLGDAGLAPEDLRNLCAAHIEVLGDTVSRMIASLPAGHVIHTMIQEHERILGFLDELEIMNQTVQQEECAVSVDFVRLYHVRLHRFCIHTLVGAGSAKIFPASEQNMNKPAPTQGTTTVLTDMILEGIAAHLLGAEPHHQREEQVLFAELENRGLFGQPRVMRMEHEDLRIRKHARQ
jgi:DUF438 domain-containing protein